MIKQPNFYSVIIGTELLDGRRVDSHFEFLNKELNSRGFIHKASFVIDDDPLFMKDVFEFIKNDPNGVMFSFGGIGATPDDYTRDVASKVFSDEIIVCNLEAKSMIIDRFGDDAYPFRVNMAKLPSGAKLLKNVVNNIPGFYLEDRYFFVPGFPNMAHPMVLEALDRYYISTDKKIRLSLLAQASENECIEFYDSLPFSIELSSLPHIQDDKRSVEISLSSYNKDEVKIWHNELIKYLKNRKIIYKEIECL
jgi:molybdopterin-biosynthesis enzyme MoeA-like protein